MSDGSLQSECYRRSAMCESVTPNQCALDSMPTCITGSTLVSAIQDNVHVSVASGQRSGIDCDQVISNGVCESTAPASGGCKPLYSTDSVCEPTALASGEGGQLPFMDYIDDVILAGGNSVSGVVNSAGVYLDCPTSNNVDAAHWVTERSAGCGSKINSHDSYVTYPHITSTCPLELRLLPRHNIGGMPSQMNLNGWNYYLQFEDDDASRCYFQDGISQGFAIVDKDDSISSYCCDNYSSALTGEAFTFVNNLIASEISEGKYVKATSQPHCIHSLGAIPKRDGSYRPITDCRRPEGISINNHMQDTFQSFNYITIDRVASNVSQGCYMATVDISSAYRSVSIREDQWTFQGIQWPIQGELIPLWDVRLSFGLRCAPFIFSEMSDFVARTMERLGYLCVANYLDNFLVYGDTFQSCQAAQQALITLLGDLGFIISWKKCTTASTCVRYLGILRNSEEMSLSLPEDKLHKLHSELQFFTDRNRATKKQLQRLCGIIAHCSKVVRGGRTFSRRIIDLLSGLPDGNPRIRLSSEFKLDMVWWLQFSNTFNGKEFIIFPNEGDGPFVATDASLKGYGIVSDMDWQAGYFNSDLMPDGMDACSPSHDHWLNVDVNDAENINYLELIPIWLSLKRYSSMWENCHVLCLSDNTQVVAMMRRGHSVNKQCMVLLRNIFWICALNNIYLTPEHIQGKFNYVPDMLSRIAFSNSLTSLRSTSICCSGCI